MGIQSIHGFENICHEFLKAGGMYTMASISGKQYLKWWFIIFIQELESMFMSADNSLFVPLLQNIHIKEQ